MSNGMANFSGNDFGDDRQQQEELQAQYEFSVEQAIATIRESARFMGQAPEAIEPLILKIRALCNVN